jgi:hypothetical protein
MKEITVEFAREYNDLNFEDEGQLRSFFEGFSLIATDALEILVKGCQDELYLNDIRMLDDESFELLSQIRGKSLALNGISEISYKQAECLSRAEWDDLHLRRFNCEDAHIINLLLQGSPDVLSLGINGHSLVALRALEDFEGSLSLPNVCRVGVEESEIIKSFMCSTLTLHGLSEIEAQPIRNLFEMKMFDGDDGRLDIDNVLESNLSADAIRVLEESDIDVFSLWYDGIGKRVRDGNFDETKLHK